jgi:glycine dehydrogenase subunit 1
MLAAIGAGSIEDLFASVPEALRLRAPLDLPPAIHDEITLRRHIVGLLERNTHTGEVLSFLGGGCTTGHVPAVVDEIVNRAEFVTAYGGGPYGDLGKYQAIFEFQTLLAELLGMEVVSSPTYDGVTAATSSLLMATRLTDRPRVLVPATLNWQTRQHLATIVRPPIVVEVVPKDGPSGLMDLAALKQALGPDVAAVLIENPSWLGFVEERAADVAELAHGNGSLFVVSVDPSTLGVLAAPADYGADIACGDAQTLGIHPLFGGGQCGFIAHRDDERYVRENPSIMISAVPERDGDAVGFAWSGMDSLSYNLRGDARDFTGTSQWLWGIGVAVYLSLLGPSGIRELGEGLVARTAYLKRRLAVIPGVRVPAVGRSHIREVVVGFDAASVEELNLALRERGIFGGRDLSGDMPWLGQAALYAVTEGHDEADIDRLADAIAQIVA